MEFSNASHVVLRDGADFFGFGYDFVVVVVGKGVRIRKTSKEIAAKVHLLVVVALVIFSCIVWEIC